MLLTFISLALVNNLLLTQFLGLCPFMGVSRQTESAFGMGMATLFVLTLSAGVSHLVYTHLLLPHDLVYLRTIVFITLIACIVGITELYIQQFLPLLHQVLGLYLPLITSNCAVLGVALLQTQQSDGFFSACWYGFSAAAGFSLVLWLFAHMRERLALHDVPAAFQGAPIALITAGIMSLALMGLAGVVS